MVVRRLPIYARTLDHLLQEGVTHVSSNELGERIGISAAQIRRDLAYFGDFGKQGKGYNVQFLLSQMKDILRLQQDWNMAVVGMGHLGRALARYEGFRQGGFCITALFDHDPQQKRAARGRSAHPADERDAASGGRATISRWPCWPCPPTPRRKSPTNWSPPGSGPSSIMPPRWSKFPRMSASAILTPSSPCRA